MAGQYDEPNKIQGYAEPSFGFQIKAPDSGFTLNTHRAGDCLGPYCCIHNPSDHPLKDNPLNWRADRALMERICDHGVGHPDPDDISFKRLTRGHEYADAEAHHGCDGCCQPEAVGDGVSERP